MRRILLVLAVTALMVTTMLAVAMPAFADKPNDPGNFSEKIQTCRERQLEGGFSQRAASFNCNFANQQANPDRV